MKQLTLGLAALLLGAFAAGCSSEGGGGDGGGGSAELAIEFFRANPDRIAPGEETILSWKTKNATSIRITDGKNDRIGQGTENEGSVTAKPAETMTYRLVAQNSSGDSKEATVQVIVQENVGPTLSFSSTQSNVDFESSTFLRWETTGAVRVVIAVANGGEVLVDTDRDSDKTKLSGDYQVTPTRTTIYEATATDEKGTTNTKAVEVIVDPVITTFASPDLDRPIPIGTDVTLNWVTRGADEVEITTPEGESYTVPESDRAVGTTTMKAGESGIFTLKATRGKGEKTREFKAQMREFPAVEQFEASPGVINAGQPTPVTVSWKVSNADTVQIVAGANVLVPTTTELEGSKDFTASANTTITLTATNLAGDTTRDIVVLAVARPEIVSFEATPNRVTPFGTTRLSWSTTNASSLTLQQTDDLGEVTNHPISQDADGTIDINLSSRSTFKLTARNDANAFVDETAVVEIGPPVVDTFTASKARFGSADPIVLSWTGRGGRNAKVYSIERDDAGDPINPVLVCEVNFPAVASAGTCTAAAQTTFGRYEFRLVLEDGTFSSDAFVSALVSDGPVIERFLASPAQIDEGDSTIISWTVQKDAAGNSPELTLKVNGTVVAVPEMASSPMDGTATLDFPTAGVHRLELSATSDGGATFADKATTIVTVVGAPSIGSFTATPDTVDDGDPVTLAWTMTNVSSATIRDAATNTLVYTIPANRLASGDYTFAPTGAPSFTYRLIAVNQKNVQVQQNVTVTVIQPTAQINAFTVPATATAGQTITVDWNTQGGTKVLLTPFKGPATLLSSAPFEDISTTGTPLTMADCGSWWLPESDGCATINFSSGFTFPYDGQERTGVQVNVHGFLSFDLVSELGDIIPFDFPDEDVVHLAPFWDYITIGAGGTAPAGSILYQQKTGPNGPYLVVQWSHARNDPMMGSDWNSPTDSVDLNFQVILWANGAVEYRYGLMSSPAPYENEAGGRYAIIGYQNTSATDYDMLSEYNLAVPGGLSNRSWGYFEEAQQPTGSLQFTVTKTTIFTLCLEHAAGRTCQKRTVTVN